MTILELLATNRKYRNEVLTALMLMALALFLCARFLLWAQARPAESLNDWFLNWLPATDLSWIIFATIYGLVLICLQEMWYRPQEFLIGLWSYTLITLLRMICIYLVPLGQPLRMVSLNDPMVQWALGQNLITKDLFFSGHTATVSLLIFLSQNRVRRGLMIFGSCLVGIFVLIQHVHYAIDVIAAPLFSGLSFFLVKKLCRRSMTRSSGPVNRKFSSFAGS